MRDIKQVSEKPQGIFLNRGINILILLPLLSPFVQLHNVKLS